VYELASLNDLVHVEDVDFVLEMNENSRCSIVVHLRVPGGK
jgi:hypothetical protein